MKSIAVFARWPAPGKVKTRLSPALPPELACTLYRAMLADAFAAAATTSADRRLVYWAERPGKVSETDEAGGTADTADPGAPGGFEVRLQRGADLGERLG